MNFFKDLFKGIFVGIANVIPGVSGGTMAVSFGIYDKLIHSISNLLKDFKKSFRTLLPIILGMAIGVIAFTFIIPILLEKVPFATSMAFTGLIIGGLPMIFLSLKNGWVADTKKSLPINIIIFIVFAAIALAMPFMNGDKESGILLTPTPATMIIVFLMGAIAAAAMVIPGVSGSLLLMVLGYYFGIISSIKNFLSGLKEMDFGVMLHEAMLLAPFALGCILGIFFIAKLIGFLLNRFASATYSAIIGLIVVSPVSIFYKVGQEYDMSHISTVQVIVGILLLLLCLAATAYMGHLDQKRENA